MAIHPTSPAKNVEGEFDRFNNAMKRILSVSKVELQRRMEEEKSAKAASSHGPVSSSY
jgi:hypothetical protein